MSLARLLLVWVLLFVYAPPTAEAQTTDSGLGGIASTSTASVAKEMQAAIRRNLAEAAASMPAEEYSFNPAPRSGISALNDSLAYCDAVYSTMTDLNFNQTVKTRGLGGDRGDRDTSLGSVRIFNTAHNNEHYGNMVV